MVLTQLLIIAIGMAILLAGGELLIRGAVDLARRYGLPTAVIGLTVVAYGTSAPELVVSANAAISNSPNIALGNVIGSNFCNLLLVLGAAAILVPMTASRDMITRDGGVLIASTALLIFACWDGWITNAEALLFIIGITGYTLYNLSGFGPKREEAFAAEAHVKEGGLIKKNCTWCAYAYVIIGLAMLITGSDIMIEAAVKLAREWGVSDTVIGLTVVAVGTSTPEMAATLIAIWRKENDLSLANVLGSSIFNILGIIGVSAFLSPVRVDPQLLKMDLWLLAAITALVLALFYKGTLHRGGGAVLLAIFAGYTIYQYSLTGVSP